MSGPQRLGEIMRTRVLPRIKPPNISDAEWEQMKRDVAEAEQQLDANMLHARMRGLAYGADDGTGHCKWCGAALGTEVYRGVERKTHPLDERGETTCAGPPFKCDVCGTEWRKPAHDGCPTCLERARAAAAEIATKRADEPITEMKPLRRVRGVGEDAEDD